MSRQYDAKRSILKAHPTNRALGVELFLEYLDVSEKDFIYAEGQTPEEYIYGKPLSSSDRGSQ